MVVEELQEIEGATFCDCCCKPCVVHDYKEVDHEPYGERRVQRITYYRESECCKVSTTKLSLMQLADMVSDILPQHVKVDTHESKECSMVFDITDQEQQAFIYLYNGDRFCIKAQKLEYEDLPKTGPVATDYSKAGAWIYDWCESTAQEFADYYTDQWTEYQCKVEDNTMRIWWRL